MSTKNILIAVIGGAVAGAAAAVLLAPDSGKETRRKLARSATDAKDSIEQFLLRAEEQITQWCDKTGAKEDGRDVRATARSAK